MCVRRMDLFRIFLWLARRGPNYADRGLFLRRAGGCSFPQYRGKGERENTHTHVRDEENRVLVGGTVVGWRRKKGKSSTPEEISRGGFLIRTAAPPATLCLLSCNTCLWRRRCGSLPPPPVFYTITHIPNACVCGVEREEEGWGIVAAVVGGAVVLLAV